MQGKDYIAGANSEKLKAKKLKAKNLELKVTARSSAREATVERSAVRS
jgi:hypothetical protein